MRKTGSHNTSLTLIALACMLAISAPALAQQSANFDQAVKLYSQRQYKQALGLFLKCAQENQRDGSAYYYAATCFYQLGNVQSAKQTYQTVVRCYPSSKEAALASQFLLQLEQSASASQKGASNQSAGKNAPASKIAAAAAPSASSGAGVDPGAPVDCSALLQIIRPVQDHPAVSTELTAAMRDKLSAMPAHVGKLLNESHIKIQVTTTMIDAHPELKDREGRGYDGYTYKSCPGMFTGNEIVLCERTMSESDESVRSALPVQEVINTFDHECGHAVDYCLGEVSTSDAFKHDYLLDANNLTRTDPDTANELRYYLQKSDAGQEECCGELIGILLGKSDDKTDKMKRAFPQTLGFLKGKLHMQ